MINMQSTFGGSPTMRSGTQRLVGRVPGVTCARDSTWKKCRTIKWMILGPGGSQTQSVQGTRMNARADFVLLKEVPLRVSIPQGRLEEWPSVTCASDSTWKKYRTIKWMTLGPGGSRTQSVQGNSDVHRMKAQTLYF